MKKVHIFMFVISLILMAVLTVGETNQTTPVNPIGGTNQTLCTGGACSVDNIRKNMLFNNTTNTIFSNEDFITPPPPKQPVTTDGLGEDPYLYDPNCQFGNCLNQPSGSSGN